MSETLLFFPYSKEGRSDFCGVKTKQNAIEVFFIIRHFLIILPFLSLPADGNLFFCNVLEGFLRKNLCANKQFKRSVARLVFTQTGI